MKTGPSAHRGFLSHLWRIVHKSGVAIPLLFIVLTARFAPIAYFGEFDTDEGVNLMKALLVSRGHTLYSEIWSDQAPLATVILSQWIRWFGTSVVASRILVLLFSALLIWAFYQAVRFSLSEAVAWIAVAFLLLSAWYVRLSISVMIGLPALALAVLSIYLLLLGQERRGPWLTIASGVVLAASLQTKLFTGILVPVILVYLLFVPPAPGGQVPFPLVPPTPRDLALRKRIGRCAAWLGALLATFVITGFVFRSLDPSQLVEPHLSAATRTAFLQRDNLAYIGTAILRHIAYLPLAIVGLVWAFKNRVTVVFLPLGWLLMALAFLIYERPLWYHHTLVMTIPIVWLSAFGVEAGLRALRRAVPERMPIRTPTMWAFLLLGAAIALLAIFDPVTRKPRLSQEIPGPVPEYGRQVADWLCPGGRSKDAWVFTDRPIYAFRAGLGVPPPIAVLTAKRLLSGAVTEDDLLAVLRDYGPKYVLLERYLPNYEWDFLTAVASMYDLAREYSLGPEGWPGQLLLSHQTITGNGTGANRGLATARFGDWLSLEWNPAFSSGESEAGDCLQVRDLQWSRPETVGAQDLALSVRLADQFGEVWVQHDEELGADKNTLRDHTRLPYFVNLLIPEGTPPGVYDTQLVVYDPRSGQPLPVTADDAGLRPADDAGLRPADDAGLRPADDAGLRPAADAGLRGKMIDGDERLVLGQIQIVRPAQGSLLRRPLADFGPVRLVEAETPATKVSPGDSVPLSLVWQAGPDFRQQSLVVVAQLLDKQGKVVASLEEEPLRGSYPTTAWQPRELVRDRHNLSVPAGTPPGRYELIVGVYTLPDRTRLKTGAGFLGLAQRDYFPIRQVQVGSASS